MRVPRRRTVFAAVATIAVLAPLVAMRQASLLPESYSVMDMGMGHGGSAGGRSVTELVDPTTGPPDVDVQLTAAQDGDRFTLNGQSPGPEIRAEQGQLVQVRLVNRSVPAGVTLHWHGVDVPNAMDGVAGVTQDAVPVGGSFTYRFVAEQPGTYWYHSHQLSHEQVRGGLLGGLVITPPGGGGAPVDALALVHLFAGRRTINGTPGDLPVAAAPGQRVRVRVVNTDDGAMPVWVSGAAYRLVAVDGRDLHDPSPVDGASVLVTAGGRADLEVDLPADGTGARVEMGGSAAMVLGSGTAPTRTPTRQLDLLRYGAPAPLGFDPATPDRSFDYVIGRRPGFVDGVPGVWWTINGRLFPDVPMFTVAEGDVVRVHVANDSGESHPMHLHGHHLVVLARDGVAAAGSPWWVDSLEVAAGATYDVAFVADNPGIWADHCHNLPHAAEGLVAHLMYEGVRTPFLVGPAVGNTPE